MSGHPAPSASHHHGFEDLLAGRSGGGGGPPRRGTPMVDRAHDMMMSPAGSDAGAAPQGISRRAVLMIGVFVVVVLVIVVVFVRRVRARNQQIAEPATERDLPPIVAGGVGAKPHDSFLQDEQAAQARAHMQRLQQHQQMEQMRHQQMQAAHAHAQAQQAAHAAHAQQNAAPDPMFQPMPTRPLQ